VNEIEIEIGEAETVEAGLESRFDALGAMVGIPASGIKVPKPRAGICPAPWVRGMRVRRRS